MEKTAKWAVIIALTVSLHTVVFLAITGVPKPPALTTEHVGRVAWAPLLKNAGQMLRARESGGAVTWMPDGSGMLVSGAHLLIDSRLHTLARAGGRASFLPQIPRNAAVYSSLGRDYMVLGWDTDGDEQFSLYRWDLGDAAPVLLTSEEERAGFGAFEPEGDRIAFTSSRRNGKDFDVYVMDVTDPQSDEVVLQVEGAWSVAGWSAVASELLLVQSFSNVHNELYTFDLGTRALMRITPDGTGPARHGSPRWSHDGASLFYTSDRGTEFAHLRRLDLATGRETILSDEIPWDVLSYQKTRDDRLLLVSVNEDGRTVHYTTDAWGEEFQELALFTSGEFSAELHPTELTLLVNHLDPLGHARGFTYDIRSGELEQWVGGDISESDVPAPRLIHYPTFDSVDGGPRLIPAFVYPGVGEGPRPVVISIHGGPEAQARIRPAQASQREGITVITPNVRGSTGYGRTFASLDDQYLRENSVRDIGALLDWVAAQPDLDASRVAVMGGSYGGYMVLASLVHFSPQIQCGIDIVGVSNFVTFLENTAEYRRDLRRAEYGDERIPEMRAFLERIAPLNNAERITSRLMVVQGANDPRVPVTESRQMVERVAANGLDVAYIEGANEGHGFRHPWNALWAGLAQQEVIRECLLER